MDLESNFVMRLYGLALFDIRLEANLSTQREAIKNFSKQKWDRILIAVPEKERVMNDKPNNLPGFTAETTLQRLSGHYRRSTNGTTGSATVVQPALRFGGLNATCTSTDGTSTCTCPVCAAGPNTCTCLPPTTNPNPPGKPPVTAFM